MAFIDLGKLKFNWQGTWNNSTAYEVDDVVFHDNQTWVATANVATAQAEPQANTDWSLMAGGLNYRGTYASSTTYYLHDMVTYGSALYMLTGITETGSQTGVDPGSNPGSDNWEQLTPAPAANVMHTVGDMVIRNNANQNARLEIVEQVNKGLTVQEAPLETYSSRAFTYELNSTYGNVINTPGSIPAETYNIDVKAQRSTNYVIDGSDRDGDINWEYDGPIRVNIGDTIVFDTSAIYPSHPLAIRVSDGGASVSTGTYTGEGTTTVTWVTTGVAAGTYYYQCTSHAGMIGQIIVEDTTNRQGSAGANGTMQVCRGKTYTITLDNVTSGLSYNLFNASAPQAGTTNAITTDEGNSAPAGTSYSGSAVTFTFTPNETTPDTVYLSSASNTSDQVEITVNDLAYVPSWGTASIQESGADNVNNREFTHWQDWYAYGASGIQSGLGYDTTDHQRRPLGPDTPLVSRRIPSNTGTASWTVPDNVSRVRITCVGGGGGGGNYNSNYYSGHGGGGGSFTSAEYDVTAGTVLTVTTGKAGYGAHYLSNTGVVYGGNGGTSQVSGTGVNIAANGGQGGGYYNTYAGAGGTAVTPSGSGLDSTTIISSAGGRGGYGSQNAHGFGTEDYPAGGGGSAGSMFGNGFKGGDGGGGGYSSPHPGGAGIGGAGGFARASDTTTNYYDGCAGSGGGSYGPGISGGRGETSGTIYGGGGAQFAEGGVGALDYAFVAPYVDDKQSHYVRGQNSARMYYTAGAGNVADHSVSFGARYGDGEVTGPVSGADDTNTLRDRVRTYLGDKPAATRATGVTFPTKAFNGVLGRLWGGGGAGHGCKPVDQDTHASNMAVAHAGGCGGAGAGGGGATWTYSCWGVGHTYTVTDYHVWDPANLAWRVKDSALDDARYYRGAFGGCGGALGGGGSGGSFYHSGMGGIGGGGGGGAGQHSYSSYNGRGGDGGVGYVLIEWKYDE